VLNIKKDGSCSVCTKILQSALCVLDHSIYNTSKVQILFLLHLHGFLSLDIVSCNGDTLLNFSSHRQQRGKVELSSSLRSMCTNPTLFKRTLP
jgi:hypothetical protein